MADDAKTTRRRRRLGGHELVAQLNEMIAELIKENRKLKREVDKLAARGTAVASTTVDRGLRTLQRRVQRALTTTTKRRRKPSTNGRRTRRRKKSA
jgi:molybdenum-dependent DNA-binding transcriptional regulator ModE